MLLPQKGTHLPTLDWVPSPNHSPRQSPVTLVVVHDTEGAYGGAISWFQNPKSQVSAHLVLREDGGHATQMVPYNIKAWHCAAFNSAAIGLELAGHANKGYPDEQLRVAARIVAFLCNLYSLPTRYVGTNVARKGWTFHQDLGAAGGSHSDPGIYGLRKRQFRTLCYYESKRGGFIPHWGKLGY